VAPAPNRLMTRYLPMRLGNPGSTGQRQSSLTNFCANDASGVVAAVVAVVAVAKTGSADMVGTGGQAGLSAIPPSD